MRSTKTAFSAASACSQLEVFAGSPVISQRQMSAFIRRGCRAAPVGPDCVSPHYSERNSRHVRHRNGRVLRQQRRQAGAWAARAQVVPAGFPGGSVSIAGDALPRLAEAGLYATAADS